MRVLIAVLVLIASGSQALAKIQLCNKFKHPINVALAYEQNGAWVSDGWITIDPGQCQIDAEHADLTSFYYYGETGAFDGSRWTWGKNKDFSVKDGNFTLRNADTRQAGARVVKFSGPHTYKLPETLVLLEFNADLSVTFVVPNENANARQPSDIDAAQDACDNKSGDVAIRGCTVLINNNPNDAVAYYNRGIEYEGKHDYDRAIADYSKCISIKPDYARAYNNRGTSFYFGKDDVGHAIADFTKAIDLDSNYAPPLGNRGNVYRAIGANVLALKDLDAAIKLNPKSVPSFYHRGLVHEALGRKDNAIADFRQVLILDPNDQDSKNAMKRLGISP